MILRIPQRVAFLKKIKKNPPESRQACICLEDDVLRKWRSDWAFWTESTVLDRQKATKTLPQKWTIFGCNSERSQWSRKSFICKLTIGQVCQRVYTCKLVDWSENFMSRKWLKSDEHYRLLVEVGSTENLHCRTHIFWYTVPQSVWPSNDV